MKKIGSNVIVKIKPNHPKQNGSQLWFAKECIGLIGYTHHFKNNCFFIKWYKNIEDLKANKNYIDDNGWWYYDDDVIEIIDYNKEDRIAKIKKQIMVLEEKIKKIENEG